MSGHTRARPTNNKKDYINDEESVSWKKAYRKEIKKFSEVGLYLRGIRLREGFTQEKLAKKLKISQHHISEMENGKRTISPKMARNLAKVLHTDYRMFL